jgi:WD40 repeat protein
MLANAPGSQVIAEKRIALDHNPGREYHLQITGKGTMVARVYFVRNRIYALVIAGRWIKPDSEDVAKFFDSFRPDPIDEKAFPPLRLDQQPPDIEDEDIYPGRKVLGREEHPVTRIVISRDGGTVAAGCEEGTIELWDLGSGERWGNLHFELGFQQPFHRPDFDLSPDGKTIAAGVPGGGLKLFDARTQNEIAALIPGKPPNELANLVARGEGPAWVNAVVFSPGSRYLASGHHQPATGGEEIRLWDVPARKLVRTIPGGKGLGPTMVFTPDGRYLVNGGKDGILRWLDPLAGGEVKRLTLSPNNGQQTAPVTALAFTADGGTLAVSYQHTLRLWNVRTGENRILFQHGGSFPALDISANGRFIVTGTGNGELRVSETAAAKQRWLQPGFDLGRVEPAQALAFTPDGKRLVLGRGKRVEVWDLDQLIRATPEELAEPKDRPAIAEPAPSPGDLVPQIDAHVTKDPNAPHGVFALALSPDDKTLLTVNWDRSLRLWDPASGQKRGEASIGVVPIGFSASPDGKMVAVADPFSVFLHDAATGQRRATLRPDAAEAALKRLPPASQEKVKAGTIPPDALGAGPITAIAFASDGATLAVSVKTDYWKSTVEFWDVATKKVRRQLVTETHNDHLAFAPDGRTLAAGVGNEPTVRLYDVPAGKLFARLRGLQGGVSAVAYSADGKYIAASGGGPIANSLLLLWDANTGRELRRFSNHSQRILSLAFSPDGKTLSSGGQDAEVHVYDTASGESIAAFAGMSHGIGSLTFTHDNRTLIAGTGRGEVYLWSVANLPRPKLPAQPVVENKPPAPPLAFGKDLQRIGQIEPFLAAVVDPQAGRALFLGRDRFLRVYSYPGFKPQRAYWLGAAAYQATLDRQRGVLYAAVSDLPAVDYMRNLPDGAPTDIRAYDVKQVLSGEDKSGSLPRPTVVVRLKMIPSRLLCTPDGSSVYYLVRDNRGATQLGRIDDATRRLDRERRLNNHWASLCVSQDGKTLYVGHGSHVSQNQPGTIEVFDAATMQARPSLAAPFTPLEMAAGEAGRLLVGAGSRLAVIDTRPAANPAVVANWSQHAYNGRYHLGIVPRRLYVHEMLIPSTIRAFTIPDGPNMPKEGPAREESLSDGGDGSLVKDLIPTEDGKYLLCQTGAIVRLAQPGINRPLPEPAEDAKPPVDPKASPWRERPPLAAPKKNFFHALAFSPDGQKFAVGGSGGIDLYDGKRSHLLGRPNAGASSGIAYLTFSPDSRTLACADWDRKAHVLEVSNGAPLNHFWHLSSYGRDAVAFTPDGTELAAGGEGPKRGIIHEPLNREVVFWGLHRKGAPKTVDGFPDPLTAVALSPDGKRLAAGSLAGSVHQVNVAQPRERLVLRGHSAEIRCLAYSPDGKMLASAGVDGTVRLWDPATGKQVRTLRGHTNVVLCLAFSPDGKQLVTGGADGSVRVWDPVAGKERGVIPPRRPGAMVYALAFAPDGKSLAAACGEEVRQWDIDD